MSLQVQIYKNSTQTSTVQFAFMSFCSASTAQLWYSLQDLKDASMLQKPGKSETVLTWTPAGQTSLCLVLSSSPVTCSRLAPCMILTFSQIPTLLHCNPCKTPLQVHQEAAPKQGPLQAPLPPHNTPLLSLNWLYVKMCSPQNRVKIVSLISKDCWWGLGWLCLIWQVVYREWKVEGGEGRRFVFHLVVTPIRKGFNQLIP